MNPASAPRILGAVKTAQDISNGYNRWVIHTPLTSRPLATAGTALLLLAACGSLALISGGAPLPSRKSHKAANDLARFGARVQTVLARPPALKASFGLLVEDADTGATLYQRNADSYFAPASTTKLFTTSFALSTLGPGYRFHTTLSSSAMPGLAGILPGDLVLTSCGDPSLSNRVYPYAKKTEREGPPDAALAAMVDAVSARGVRQVRGDVVADASCFPGDPFPDGWELEDVKFSYGAAVSAIVINDNQLTGELSPGSAAGEVPTLLIEPEAGYYHPAIHAVTAPAGATTQLDAHWLPGSRDINITGAIALGATPIHLEFGNPQPVEFAAALLKRLLEQHGITVSGVARPEYQSLGPSSASSPQILAEHISPPLSEIVMVVNKASENLYAELLLRAAANAASGAAPLTLSQALAAEMEFLQQAGVNPEDVLLADGSGLSRRDLVTPRAELAILRYISRQSWRKALLASLPVAGEDGTLRKQMRDPVFAGRIRAKTGSLEHSKALAGYATTLSGRHLRFAMFLDDFDGTAAEADGALDAIAQAMVEEIGSRRPHGRRR